MTLRLFNTLTGQAEEFVPIVPGRVRMYVCGMTIYDLCHMGHARMMMAFDVVYRWLQVLGYETDVEYDPLQALVCARERAFDAFVLDIGLPGMDGHDLARHIRTLPGQAGALFIALTGYGQQQDRDASAAAGFHYHFVKPANVDALARALENGVPA